MIFLDTCFIIDFLRGDKNAKALLQSLNDDFAVSSMSIFESFVGVYRSNSYKELVMLTEFFSDVNERTVRDYGQAALLFDSLVRKGLEIPKHDCLIAAAVLQNNCSKLVTRDVKHFSRIPGIEVITY